MPPSERQTLPLSGRVQLWLAAAGQPTRARASQVDAGWRTAHPLVQNSTFRRRAALVVASCARRAHAARVSRGKDVGAKTEQRQTGVHRLLLWRRRPAKARRHNFGGGGRGWPRQALRGRRGRTVWCACVPHAVAMPRDRDACARRAALAGPRPVFRASCLRGPVPLVSPRRRAAAPPRRTCWLGPAHTLHRPQRFPASAFASSNLQRLGTAPCICVRGLLQTASHALLHCRRCRRSGWRSSWRVEAKGARLPPAPFPQLGRSAVFCFEAYSAGM